MRPGPPRLIDLHSDWPLQYAPDTSSFAAAFAAQVSDRLGRTEGYLGATAAAFLMLDPAWIDRARSPDPWAALDLLITRAEAEFPGRLLRDPADLGLWEADAGGLAWGVLGVAGAGPLLRTADDLDRLPGLVARGLRVFGLAALMGDEVGLSDLGRAGLVRLLDLVGPGGARLLLDLAGLRPATRDEALDWFEADPGRSLRVIPIVSRATLRPGDRAERGGLSPDVARRLRALGGVVGLDVGPPEHESAEELGAAVRALAESPFLGRSGFEGIAFGTGYLGAGRAVEGLGTAPGVVAWASRTFDGPTAAALIEGNGRRLAGRMLASG